MLEQGNKSLIGLNPIRQSRVEELYKSSLHLEPLNENTYLQQHKNKSILLIGHPPCEPTLSNYLNIKKLLYKYLPSSENARE